MNKFIRLVSLGGIAMVAVSAHAIVIDDFTSGAYDITVNNASPTVAEAVRNGTMLGGQRDALLRFDNGPDGTQVRANVVLSGGGVQFFNADSEADGTLILQYDGDDGEVEDGVLNNGSGLNADWTGQNAFAFDWRFVDGGSTNFITLVITVEAANGTFTSGNIVVPATNVAMTQIIPFATVGAFDNSDVRRVEFRFFSTASADFTLDNIRVVPGPAAIIPFMVGIAGAMARRRRK